MLKNLSAQRFGRLIAREPVGTNKSGNTLWRCECDCGGETVAVNSNLTRGNTKSCGCHLHDMLVERNTTHGMVRSPTYAVWRSMIGRCYTRSNTDYPHYGGRGITVYVEWRNDFPAFHEWAITSGYADGLTLDRIDNDGDYRPENCRWATQLRQANNKRNTLYITVRGATASLADMCREYGSNYKTTWKRLQRGWPPEDALLGRGG